VETAPQSLVRGHLAVLHRRTRRHPIADAAQDRVAQVGLGGEVVPRRPYAHTGAASDRLETRNRPFGRVNTLLMCPGTGGSGLDIAVTGSSDG